MRRSFLEHCWLQSSQHKFNPVNSSIELLQRMLHFRHEWKFLERLGRLDTKIFTVLDIRLRTLFARPCLSAATSRMTIHFSVLNGWNEVIRVLEISTKISRRLPPKPIFLSSRRGLLNKDSITSRSLLGPRPVWLGIRACQLEERFKCRFSSYES